MKPGGGQPNMQQLLKQAQKMQRDLASAQEELASTEVEGSAGGGLVSATVTGTGQVVSIHIDPAVVDRDDVETLEDLVVAAINDATRQASDLQAERMGPLAGGLSGMGIPGLA
jgi:DNA-binding YbaB/EbfC family protein